MASNTVIAIDFHGTSLLGFSDGAGGQYIALRPLVVGMGLNWSGQYSRLKRDPILAEAVCVMQTPLETGGAQETLCLPLDLIPGFLFRITASRVDEALRPRVIMFQRECFRVLAQAFAPRPRVERVAEPPPPSPIETTGQDHARKLVTEARQTFDTLAARQLWFKLGLPIVPAMYEAPLQLGLFTYDAQPARPAGGQ